MTVFRSWLSGVRLQTLVGLTLVPLLVFLFVKSSHTGRAEYEAAEEMLGEIEALDLELNATVFPLLFEITTDFDGLTSVQGRLYEATAAYAESTDGQDVLFEMIRDKARLVNDFKANQAVMRNSRAIAAEMLRNARARSDIEGSEAEIRLFEVERDFLEFVGRRDPPSISRLKQTIDATAERSSVVSATIEWDTFVAHADKLIEYSEQMATLMMGMLVIPVPQQLTAELEALAGEFEEQSQIASSYRFAMFATALLLLAFSAFKAVQVRRYYGLLAGANAELEQRVTERTRELSEANRALQSEIRDRINVESQLRTAQKLESIGELAAGIAHEINTPTQYVSDNVAFVSSAWQDVAPVLDDYERSLEEHGTDNRGRLTIWKRADVEYLREEVPAALSAATEGLSQIGRIVRAIRDFSHPGDDTLHPDDLNRAIQNAVTVARNEWKYVADVSLDLDESLPKVPCNVSAFNQVILNLIVNSAQAIQSAQPAGRLGSIRISTRQDGEHAEIVVEDDGPGVPEEIRHRVFDPFFTTKEVGKGTGQGLAIAFRVVTKQHGGTLTVGSAAGGRGARLAIRLPLRQPRGDEHGIGRDEDITDTIRRLKLRADDERQAS